MASSNGASRAHRKGHYGLTALKRWSILNKQLPAASEIRALHVYDFDNTLFRTPLPNAKLWNGSTIGFLQNQDSLANGGWWHDSRILAATGEGLVKEEVRAWEGWWNEAIVELVQLSMKQKDALCVLLTGRSEAGFSDLIKRMIASKGLEFDLVTLKPAVGPNNQRFSSTMHFKQVFLDCLVETFKHAQEIRIYEDRPKHTKAFRDFMTEYNKKQLGGGQTRGPITAEVVQVADFSVSLDPVIEVSEVQHMIDDHNVSLRQRRRAGRSERMAIKKTVFFTGYMINPDDTQRLLALAQIPPNMPETELKYHANNIMICPRPCPASILDKIGGMGSKMKWEVTGTACFENQIWAACLKPVPATAKFHTDNPSPTVVLALRKGARLVDAGKIQNWQPVPPEKTFVFETTVAEKVLLRIEAEDQGENEYESMFATKASKRKHPGDDDGHPRQPSGRNDHRHQLGRGGSNQGRFRGGANGSSNRGFRGGARGGGIPKGPRAGRAGNHHYKSLDDVGTFESQPGNTSQMSYEDAPQQGYQPAQPPLVPQGQSQGFWGSQPQYQQPTFPQSVQQPPQYGGWPQQPGVQGQQQQRPAGGPGYGSGGAGLNNFY